MAKLVEVKAIPAAARQFINEKLITKFFPGFFAGNNVAFDQESIFLVLYQAFRSYPSFWKVLVPIYFKALVKKYIFKR